MFNRLRMAVAGAVEGLDHHMNSPPKVQLPHKHNYTRPVFLALNDDSREIAKDKSLRIVLSTVNRRMPLNSGYAECINSGKSALNEDMAYTTEVVLRNPLPDGMECVIPYAYFSIYDGHAGFGAALDAYKQVHHIINQKLVDCLDDLIGTMDDDIPGVPVHPIKRQDLIRGCLESTFMEMDQIIKESEGLFYYPGGCAAMVVLFILGDCYVANAGDCRTICCTAGECTSTLTTDFSPFQDRGRILMKAYDNPSVLGDAYTSCTYYSQPIKANLGKSILYREPYMTGWAYKTITLSDLKLPLITGSGRRSRLMGTIGVARGFGDHSLVCNHHSKLKIKPLLTNLPEITILDRSSCTNKSVLVMGSDGLWDGVDCEEAAELIDSVTSHNTRSLNVLQSAASQLVHRARGNKLNSNAWVRKDRQQASADDITTFIIPLYPLMEGYFDSVVQREGKELRKMTKNLFGEHMVFDYSSKSEAFARSKMAEGDCSDDDDATDEEVDQSHAAVEVITITAPQPTASSTSTSASFSEYQFHEAQEICDEADNVVSLPPPHFVPDDDDEESIPYLMAKNEDYEDFPTEEARQQLAALSILSDESTTPTEVSSSDLSVCSMVGRIENEPYNPSDRIRGKRRRKSPNSDIVEVEPEVASPRLNPEIVDPIIHPITSASTSFCEPPVQAEPPVPPSAFQYLFPSINTETDSPMAKKRRFENVSPVNPLTLHAIEAATQHFQFVEPPSVLDPTDNRLCLVVEPLSLDPDVAQPSNKLIRMSDLGGRDLAALQSENKLYLFLEAADPASANLLPGTQLIDSPSFGSSCSQPRTELAVVESESPADSEPSSPILDDSSSSSSSQSKELALISLLDDLDDYCNKALGGNVTDDL